MKKKKISRKLSLSRETLHSLGNSAIRFAAGGRTDTWCCPISGPEGYTCVTYEIETCPPTHTDCQ